MRRLSRLLLAGIATVLLLGVASPAQAQRPENPWLLEAYGNYVVTTGTFGDLAKNGFSFGGTVGWSLSPQWWLLGNVGYGIFKKAEDNLVDWNTLAYMLSVGIDAIREGQPYDLIFYVGAGGVTFMPDGGTNETYFGAQFGGKFLYYFSPKVAITVNAVWVLARTDEVAVGAQNTSTIPFGIGIAFRP